MSRIVMNAVGLGVNSTAGTVEMVRRGEPITVSIFGDTGGEKYETYAFFRIFNKWLKSKGYPPVVRVQRTNEHGTAITLEQECHRWDPRDRLVNRRSANAREKA